MGIYQAYLPLVITLFILLLLVECIRNQWKISNTIINGIKALIPIILGLIAYFGILKFFLYYYQIELDKYQGIDSMGQFELKTLPGLIKKCFRNTLFLFKEEYCSINHTGVIKLGALILMICILVFVIYSLYYRHAGIQNVLSVILLGVFLVIGANSIEIMCPGSSIYCLMVYSMAGLICAPILINRYSRDWFMQNYLGYFYTPASEEMVQKLESETKDMPSYLDSGSIKVIDGTVVVKRG